VAPRSEDPKLIIRVINFELVQPVCPRYINVTDGQTDERTTYGSNTALSSCSNSVRSRSRFVMIPYDSINKSVDKLFVWGATLIWLSTVAYVWVISRPTDRSSDSTTDRSISCKINIQVHYVIPATHAHRMWNAIKVQSDNKSSLSTASSAEENSRLLRLNNENKKTKTSTQVRRRIYHSRIYLRYMA